MTILDTRPATDVTIGQATSNTAAQAAAQTLADTVAQSVPTRAIWELDAACRDLSTEVFFSDDVDDISAAKRICLACPVRTRCLDAAVERGEQFGIWGGHLFVAGRIILHKRRRGRPPKEARPGDRFPDVDVPDAYQRLVRTSVPV